MKIILGRIIAIVPAVLLQIAWYYIILTNLNGLLNEHLGDVLQLVFTVLSVLFVTYLVAKRDESSYRLLWMPEDVKTGPFHTFNDNLLRVISPLL